MRINLGTNRERFGERLRLMEAIAYHATIKQKGVERMASGVPVDDVIERLHRQLDEIQREPCRGDLGRS